MIRNTAMPLLLALALVGGGCATKKYVAQTEQPIQQKVDQAGHDAAATGCDARSDAQRSRARRNRAERHFGKSQRGRFARHGCAQ